MSTSSLSGEKIVERLGYETKEDGNTPSGTNVVPAQGAGDGAGCTIGGVSSGSVTITCESSDAPQDVEVTVTPGDSDPVSTNFTSS